MMDSERGHSCPPFRQNQTQCGQECPRSEKSKMHNLAALGFDYSRHESTELIHSIPNNKITTL
jgi:hypothetical protein